MSVKKGKTYYYSEYNKNKKWYYTIGDKESLSKAKKAANGYNYLHYKSEDEKNKQQFSPKPTYTFEVGEQTERGTYIIEKINDYIYITAKKKDEPDYSNMQVWEWHHLRKKHNNKNKLFNINSLFQISYSNTGLESLLSKYLHFGVDMNPSYQRDFVWTEEDKQALLDSIFNYRDIGKFVFVDTEWKNNEPMYEILDGKQRLQCIIDFYLDKIEYKGFTYSQLSSSDKHYFRDLSVNFARVKNVTKQEKLELFYHLNKGGKAVDEEHLENIRKMIEGE